MNGGLAANARLLGRLASEWAPAQSRELAVCVPAPYLVQAQGMSPKAASSTLGLLVIGAIVASPIIGALFSRNPEWRMPISVGFLAFAFVVANIITDVAYALIDPRIRYESR